MKKKIFMVTIAAILAFSLTACGGAGTGAATSGESAGETVETSVQESSLDQDDKDAEASKAAEESKAEASKAAEESREALEKELREEKAAARAERAEMNDAMRFVSGMRTGWNLGNTFDATNGNFKDGLAYETYWQGAITTQETIHAVKEAGFDSIRIPVSWHDHVDENFVIDEAWMNRVNEVIDYCVAEDLYIILNTHHDILKGYVYPTEECYETSEKYVVKIWEQLSERYRDYGEKLIFESLNEPRLVGHNNEWWIDASSADCKEAIECINRLNEAFVKTVRDSGGNNAQRYLIIPGYCTSADGVLNSGFRIPEDPSNEDPHMILAVHAYTPYDFALNLTGTAEFSSKKSGDTGEITNMMKKLYYNYVRNGIPVVIDEYGALDKKGNTEVRADHAGFFAGAAYEYNIPCFWWDNHNMTSSGECFSLLDRKKNEWIYPSIVEAIMKNTSYE